MPTYTYKARDAAGKAVKGAMDAGSKEELIEKLHKMGYMTTFVSESRPAIKVGSVFDILKGIRSEDMIMFNIQLANMINAGISILGGLNTLAGQLENKKLREAVGSVSRGVEGGDSFSDALAKQPRVFSKLFVNMVRAGEASGKLDTVLTRYAEFYERETDLKEKIKGALFYPVILLCAGIAVTIFIITFVIPQFAEIFMKSGIPLPLPTMILYNFGTLIKDFWYIIILFVVLFFVGVKYYADTKTGRFNVDRLKLKLPIFGPLHRKSAISRFARTLGTLVTSGVPILPSLDITKEVVENEVLARVIANARKAVERGTRIADPFRVSEEFPPDTVQMISVGEETGNLDDMLNKIADFYDMSLGYTVKRLTVIIEPLFLVVLGGMIGFIMASMLLPIFDMMKILRH